MNDLIFFLLSKTVQYCVLTGQSRLYKHCWNPLLMIIHHGSCKCWWCGSAGVIEDEGSGINSGTEIMSESGADPFISMIPISNHDGSLLNSSLANHKSLHKPQPTKDSLWGSLGELVNLQNIRKLRCAEVKTSDWDVWVLCVSAVSGLVGSLQEVRKSV